MKTYQLGEKLRFHSKFRGTFYLGKGWSVPEQHHCWSNGPDAEINLCFRELSDCNLILRIRCAAFLGNNSVEYQQIDISVNKQKLATWKVAQMDWYEVKIPRTLLLDGNATINFSIQNPLCPAQLNISRDSRLLGIDIDSLVVFEDLDFSLPTTVMIGAGHDLIGDVFKSSGCFYRAIRSKDAAFFNSLLGQGVYQQLANQKLIPEFHVKHIDHPSYISLVNSITGVSIYPVYYPILMFRDAAFNWLKINEILLDFQPTGTLGLHDGHYGNFVQSENATPKWCDIGSITNISSAIEFGYKEFIRCYIYPLMMLSLPNENKINVRQLMHQNPQGVDIQYAIDLFGDEMCRWGIDESYSSGNRRTALALLRSILEHLDFGEQKGFWSNYRSADALNSAWLGELLAPGQDSRYAAVIDLVRKSNTTSFIDIGCNDGIFSLMCVREGMKGLAIDLDEHAINKLYAFVREKPEIDLSVAYGGFLYLEHTADLVLALALTHHLAISQGLSFNEIAKQLAKASKKAVITEFMPDGLGGTPQHPEPSPNPLPVGYTLDNFVVELKQYFRTVNVIDYPRRTDTPYFSRRILIYCEQPV